MRWTQYARCAARVQPARRAGGLRLAAAAGVPAAQSRQTWPRCRPTPSFNTAISFVTNTNWQGYGGEIDHELSHPDARAHGAELRLRGDRHGGGDRADPRLRAPEHADDRQFLGRSDAQHAVHPAAAVAGARAGAGEPGRGADLLRLPDRAAGRVGRIRQSQARRRRPAAQGREGQSGDRKGDAEGAGHRRRPGRLADRDQAARHQRRRLLQRQLGAPVREPDAACRTSSRCWPSC